MAGRFEELSDADSLLCILITGCRWCDLPRGPQWASKSSGHRRLKSWHDDGTLE